jgi:DNA-binding NarL/FixJ family response regulator
MEVIRPIKNLSPSVILLMLSTFFDHHLKEQALAAGAADFLLKRDSPAQIIAAIRAASAQFNSSNRIHVLTPQ